MKYLRFFFLFILIVLAFSLSACEPGYETAASTSASTQKIQDVMTFSVTRLGSRNNCVEGLILENIKTLDLTAEKMNAIEQEINRKGYDPDEATYKGFNKVDEEGNKELVLILSIPLGNNKNLTFYVSGREGNRYIPLETSVNVELLVIEEFELDKGTFWLQPGGEELFPLMKVTPDESYFIDPYRRVDNCPQKRPTMNDELSIELMAVISGIPVGAEELVARLGEGARLSDKNLIYEGMHVGMLDNEKQIHIQVEEKLISIATDKLEVNASVLVLVNREKTEDTGNMWIDYAWINGEPLLVDSPTLPVLRVGTPIPYSLAQLSPDNIQDLVEIARWGTGDLIEMEFSPDNKYLAMLTTTELFVYNLETHKFEKSIDTEVIPSSIEFVSETNSLVILAGKTLGVWDVDQSKWLWQISTDKELYNISVSLDGSKGAFAICNYRGSRKCQSLLVYDLKY